MGKIFGMVVAFCTIQQFAFADHVKLERLANELVQTTYQLEYGARQAIGPRPTYRQRYAYEHIMFFRNSATRFQRVLCSPYTANANLRDHDHDELIHQAYSRLERDAYYARQTFYDLFYPLASSSDWDHDHPDEARLEALLRQSERLVYEMRYQLP